MGTLLKRIPCSRNISNSGSVFYRWTLWRTLEQTNAIIWWSWSRSKDQNGRWRWPDDKVETIDLDRESEQDISDKDKTIVVESTNYKIPCVIGKDGKTIRWRKHLTVKKICSNFRWKELLVRKKSFRGLGFIFHWKYIGNDCPVYNQYIEGVFKKSNTNATRQSWG